jgi:glutathione S-transferase
VRDDGKALTEFQAIAYWLARSYPKARLLPGDPDSDALVMETMDYVVGTLHMQGFTRIFTTDNYVFDQADAVRVKAQGEVIVKKGLAILDKVIAEKAYVAGSFSIADAALFYVEFWADKLKMKLPDNCRAHYERMLSRPAVRRVLLEEGYSLPALTPGDEGLQAK